MNKLFESKRKISTFRDLKDLVTGDKLIGRREAIIAIDENAIQELKSYVYKSEMYDELRTELQRKDNEIKQLREDIVNHIKIASEYKEQTIIKDNNWNEIKKWTNSEIKRLEKCQNDKKYVKPYGQEYNNFTLLIGAYDNVLYKINELEKGR